MAISFHLEWWQTQVILHNSVILSHSTPNSDRFGIVATNMTDAFPEWEHGGLMVQLLL